MQFYESTCKQKCIHMYVNMWAAIAKLLTRLVMGLHPFPTTHTYMYVYVYKYIDTYTQIQHVCEICS